MPLLHHFYNTSVLWTGLVEKPRRHGSRVDANFFIEPWVNRLELWNDAFQSTRAVFFSTSPEPLPCHEGAVGGHHHALHR